MKTEGYEAISRCQREVDEKKMLRRETAKILFTVATPT